MNPTSPPGPGVEIGSGAGRPTGGIRSRATSGLRWLAAAQAVQTLLQWSAQVVLARVLFPRDFGILGTAMIAVGLLVLVADLGVGSALVQRASLTPGHLVAAWRTSVWVAVALFAAGAVSGPLLAAAFGEPVLVTLVPALSIGVLFSPIGVIPRALLQRAMEFRLIAIAESVGVLLGGVAGVSGALAGAGVWSLAMGVLVTQATTAWLLYRGRPWRAGAGQRSTPEEGTAVRGFGLRVTATSALNYVQGNVDYLAIAQFLGAVPLGLYTLAFNLMALPTRKLVLVLSRVVFPAIATVQEDRMRLQRAYVLASRQIALVAVPSMAGLALVAADFVRLVYGEKWLGSIVPLQILAGTGWMRALGNPAGALLDATGRPGWNLRLNLLLAAMVAVGAYSAVPFGISAVAGAVAVANVLVFPVVQGVALRAIGMRVTDYLRALWPAVSATGMMAAVVVLLRCSPAAELPISARLLVFVTGGVVAYAGALWLFHREALLEGVRLIRDRSPG